MTVFVEIFLKGKTGEFLDHIQLPYVRNLRYLLKNGVFNIFERVNCPGQFSGSCAALEANIDVVVVVIGAMSFA